MVDLVGHQETKVPDTAEGRGRAVVGRDHDRAVPLFVPRAHDAHGLIRETERVDERLPRLAAEVDGGDEHQGPRVGAGDGQRRDERLARARGEHDNPAAARGVPGGQRLVLVRPGHAVDVRREIQGRRRIERQEDRVLGPDEGLEARKVQGTGAIRVRLAGVAHDQVPHLWGGGESQARRQHEIGALPRDTDGR